MVTEEKNLGTVRLEHDSPVVAGSFGTWTLILTVGSYGIDEGGTIKVAQRFASDWQPPQFDDSTAEGFSTITTDGDARLRPHFEKKGHDRPWMKCLVIDVFDGSLAPGDLVTLVLGDTSQGAPGTRAQTFVESAHEFRVFVDPTNACVAREIDESPKFPVVADVATELIAVVATQAEVGEVVPIFVRGRDRWGNPTETPDNISLRWVGNGDCQINSGGITFDSSAQGRVEVTAGKLFGVSNPITVNEKTVSQRENLYKKYWGDLHAQTDATVGTGTEAEYFTFGRDIARLDFTSHQGNDFQMTDEDWRRLGAEVKRFHDPGRFVVFPGYEWSGNTTAGGDHNVFFLRDDQPIFRSSHWQVPEISHDGNTPAHPVSELFERLNENGNALVGSHVGGRYADIKHSFDEKLGPLVEVLSCWGVFEWMLWDAFEMGYIVGVMCNSDGHKGRPGAEGPGLGEFGISSGLTCVLAAELTRESVFDALKNRRCYGTSGPRMDLSFEIDSKPMGSVITADKKCAISASILGCGPLESLVLYRGKEIINTVYSPEFSELTSSKRVRVSWNGSRMRGRGRRVTWDGAVVVDGTKVERAVTHSFDAPTDGIADQSDSRVEFRSQTTGDVDGIDLWLSQATKGRIFLESPVGRCEVALSDLSRERKFEMGGLDMSVTIERYPESPCNLFLSLKHEPSPPDGVLTPYFVKAIQCDGHMAWSSPIYVDRR